MVTFELVVFTARVILPTGAKAPNVTMYRGNPLAWRRVSGLQLTIAVLLLILFTVTLHTWAVGAGGNTGEGKQIMEATTCESYVQEHNHNIDTHWYTYTKCLVAMCYAVDLRAVWKSAE